MSFQGNRQTPQPGPLFRTGLRSRNAHGHVTKAILCGNLQGKLQNPPDTTSKEHRALTLTIRTPQCGSVATLFGENSTQLPGKVLKMPSLSSVQVQHLHFF